MIFCRRAGLPPTAELRVYPGEVLEAVMHSRTGHLTGALIGLAAAFAVGYLLLKSAGQLDRLAMLDGLSPPAGQPAGVPVPPGTFTVNGSVSAAGMLFVIAVITGLLASTRRLSPLAPLLAGLPVLAVGLAGHFAYLQVEPWMLRNLPASLGPASDTLLASGIWQLLGGIMLASAAMPWRWTGKPPTGWSRTEIGVLMGVLIGVLGIAGLWYLLQLANPVGYALVTFRTGLPHVFDLILLPQAAAAAMIGAFAAARWISPVAAVLTGMPLLAAGLLLVLGPVGAARWTSPLVWGAQPISFGSAQSLSMGVLVVVGGLLVVSAAAPWRWRQPSTPPAAATAAMAVETS
jgi:hypothetical protein